MKNNAIEVKSYCFRALTPKTSGSICSPALPNVSICQKDVCDADLEKYLTFISTSVPIVGFHIQDNYRFFHNEINEKHISFNKKVCISFCSNNQSIPLMEVNNNYLISENL